MTQRLPRLALLAGANGSLSPAEAAMATAGEVEVVLILDRSEAEASPALREIAESVAETVVVATEDATAVCAAVVAAGAQAVATFVDAYCPIVDEVNTRVFGRYAPSGRWGKDVQRRMLLAAGVCTVTNSPVHDWHGLVDAASRQGLPLVLKPVTGVASRDVWLLNDTDDLEAVRGGLGANMSAGFVAETYVRGPARGRGPHRADYVSAELFVSAAGTTGFLTDRPPLAMPFRETGIIGPTTVDPATERAVLAKAEAAHRALELGPGTYHIEVKLTDGQPEVLEVNGRLGGYVRRLVQLGTGTDVAPAAIRASLGLDHPLDLTWRSHVAALFLQAPMSASVIAATPRRRHVARIPGVISVEHLASSGTALDWRDGTGAAAVKVWLQGDDDEELRTRMADCAHRLDEAFDFRDVSGRRVRDEDWLARLTGTAPAGSTTTDSHSEGCDS